MTSIWVRKPKWSTEAWRRQSLAPAKLGAGKAWRRQSLALAKLGVGKAWRWHASAHGPRRRSTHTDDCFGTFGCEGGWSPEWRQPMNSQQPSGTNISSSQSARSSQSGSEQGVRAKAGEAVSKLADVAQQAGTQAKEAASSLASDANQRAKGFLNQQVASGADLAGHVADSVRSAADNLDRSAPQLADLVRGAADRVEEFSRDIRGQSVDELMRTASDFTRRQPALVFGLASLAGFVLLRVLKSNPPSHSRATHLGSE